MAGSATTQCRAAVPDATAGAAAVANVAANTGAMASATGARVPLASLPLNAMVAAPPAGGAAVAAPRAVPAARKAQAPVRVLNDLENGAGGKKRQQRGVGKAKTRAASAQAASASLAKNMVALDKAGRMLSLEGTVAGAAACADTHATVMHVVCVKGRLRHTKEYKGGRVSEEVKKAAKDAPMEVVLMTHDAGEMHQDRVLAEILRMVANELDPGAAETPNGVVQQTRQYHIMIPDRVDGMSNVDSVPFVGAVERPDAGTTRDLLSSVSRDAVFAAMQRANPVCSGAV